MSEVTPEFLDARLCAIRARLEGIEARLERLEHQVLDDRKSYVTSQVFEAKMEKLDNWKGTVWLSALSTLISIATLIYLMTAIK